MAQTHKNAPLTLVLLDWSQAGRLSAPLRQALIALCLYCVTDDEPSPDVLTRLLESNRKSKRECCASLCWKAPDHQCDSSSQFWGLDFH